MVNTETLNEFFIWEEKNLIDRKVNLLKSAEQDNSVTTTETKNELMPVDWRDITDPKLREKMRKKAWEKTNKDKIKKQKKDYYNANKNTIKERSKDYRTTNKDEIKEYKKAYYEANKNEVNLYKKTWYETNKDKVKTRQKSYRTANKDKENEYRRNRAKNDVQFKLTKNLRSRLRCALKNNQKLGSAVKDLGCSIDELKVYLESKFKPGMSWANWGMYGWHIDHIKPLASFDLTDHKQLLEACHYTNLQPLWANDNLSKGDKLEDQFASSPELNGATR
jgi:hypothetical protein